MQNQTVKGFKAMNPDMTCRDFQFEVGETFEHDGEVIPCESGFHFCKNIEDIQSYYSSDCRLFLVEASGVIVDHWDKTVTDTLTIIEEIDYLDYIDHSSVWVREVVAFNGDGLDKLMTDPAWSVRTKVATRRHRLDILVNDQCWLVRLAVAKQGYGLDVLVNDENWIVRSTASDRLQELNNG